MNYLVYRFQCRGCQHWFEHHQMSPSAYGEFLLRSETRRSERYLNGITDPVYQEVDDLLRFETRVRNRSDRERSEVLQSVFGVACDPDTDGDLFQMNLFPRCPDCGADDVETWEATEPPRVVDLEIPPVTHAAWNALSRAGKIEVLNGALDQRGI